MTGRFCGILRVRANEDWRETDVLPATACAVACIAAAFLTRGRLHKMQQDKDFQLAEGLSK